MSINRSRLAVLKRRYAYLIVRCRQTLDNDIKFTRFSQKYENLSEKMTNDINNENSIIDVWQTEFEETTKPWIKIKAANRIAWHTAKKVIFITKRLSYNTKTTYYLQLRNKASVEHLDLEIERLIVLEKINEIESSGQDF